MDNTIKLSSPATKEFWEIPVLFEDEHMIALDKPSGLLTSPDRYDAERPNLMRLLHAGIAAGKPWALAHKFGYLSNVHRLDFETSGVILLAKDKPSLVKLADQFGTEKPAKLYVALVNGSPAEAQFTVDAAIGPDQRTPGRMRVDQDNGKRARTDFEVVERFNGLALLHCRPLTGRTHQIRVHLRHAGLPIVGDAAYRGAHLFLSTLKRGNYRLKEGREERPLIPRLALHAHQLTVAHPVTGQPVTITAPLPKDFNVALKYLRKYSGSVPASLEEPA